MSEENSKGLSAEETKDLFKALSTSIEPLLEAHYDVRLAVAQRLVQQYPVTLSEAIRCRSNQPTNDRKNEAHMKVAYDKVDLLGCYLRKQWLEEQAATAGAKLLASSDKPVARRPRLGRTPDWMKKAGVSL